MSLNYLERGILAGSVVGCLAFSAWITTKPKASASSKQALSNARQQILKYPNIRMMYSTLSFLYLQGFQQNKIQSFYRMKQILKLDKPSVVVLDLSKKQHDQKYQKVLNEPKFQQSINKFDSYLDEKKEEQIKQMKDLNLQGLEKFYLINYCKKNKCQIVFGQQDDSIPIKISEQNLGSKQNNNDKSHFYRESYYVQKAIDTLKPETGWRLFLPKAPFKTIYGVLKPQLLDQVAQKWKKQFKNNYHTQVIEDQQIVQRQKNLLDAKKFGHY